MSSMTNPRLLPSSRAFTRALDEVEEVPLASVFGLFPTNRVSECLQVHACLQISQAHHVRDSGQDLAFAVLGERVGKDPRMVCVQCGEAYSRLAS